MTEFDGAHLPPRGATEAQLAAALESWGVDLTRWGRGDAKTLGHLHEELSSDDCDLSIDEAGLLRRVRNVWVDVHVDDEGVRRHLVERCQVFMDGRSRVRGIPASLGEKVRTGEDPRRAAERGLREELRLTPSAYALATAPRRENPADARSYPGLRSVYETHWFAAELDHGAYRADGYVEEQADKRTYFEWEPAAPGR